MTSRTAYPYCQGSLSYAEAVKARKPVLPKYDEKAARVFAEKRRDHFHIPLPRTGQPHQEARSRMAEVAVGKVQAEKPKAQKTPRQEKPWSLERKKAADIKYACRFPVEEDYQEDPIVDQNDLDEVFNEYRDLCKELKRINDEIERLKNVLNQIDDDKCWDDETLVKTFELFKSVLEGFEIDSFEDLDAALRRLLTTMTNRFNQNKARATNLLEQASKKREYYSTRNITLTPEQSKAFKQCDELLNEKTNPENELNWFTKEYFSYLQYEDPFSIQKSFQEMEREVTERKRHQEQEAEMSAAAEMGRAFVRLPHAGSPDPEGSITDDPSEERATLPRPVSLDLTRYAKEAAEADYSSDDEVNQYSGPSERTPVGAIIARLSDTGSSRSSGFKDTFVLSPTSPVFEDTFVLSPTSPVFVREEAAAAGNESSEAGSEGYVVVTPSAAEERSLRLSQPPAPPISPDDSFNDYDGSDADKDSCIHSF